MKKPNYAKLKTYAELDKEHLRLSKQINELQHNRQRLLWNVRRRAIELCKEHPDAEISLLGNEYNAERFLNKRFARCFSDHCFYSVIEQIEKYENRR